MYNCDKRVIILQLQIFILFYSYHVLEIIKSGGCTDFYESSPTEVSDAPKVIFIPIIAVHKCAILP